jgi:hypothetical protein
MSTVISRLMELGCNFVLVGLFVLGGRKQIKSSVYMFASLLFMGE